MTGGGTTAGEQRQGLPVLFFATPRHWEEWLDLHHPTSAGLWLKMAKKGTGRASVTYAEALDLALCYGWIDGQKASYDETFWLQRFTRRGPRSRWSKINRARALQLIEDGRMRPAGLAAVQQAQRDGRWDQAYDGQRTATVPDDLRRALDRHPAAAAFFETLDSTNRYAVLHRVQDAKRPATRAQRIEKLVAMLGRHEKLHP